MEREELDLRRARAALNTIRNSYIPPTSVLPPEVLAQVLKTVARLTPSWTDQSTPVKGPDYERIVSQVCSCWRRVAFDVCPIWPRISLIFGRRKHHEGDPIRAAIWLSHKVRGSIDVPMRRRSGVDDDSYIRMILETLAPYKKNFTKLSASAEFVKHLHVFLDLLLENDPPEFLNLDLSEYNYSTIPSTASSYSHNRLKKLFQPVKSLRICAVGLDWSSITFKQLTEMTLECLPPTCCPGLEEFSRMLSTCPHLRTLRLQGITFPGSLDFASPRFVKLEHLEYLTIIELEGPDLRRVLSILSLGRSDLHLCIKCDVGDAKTLQSLHSFAGRANVYQVTFLHTLFGGTLPQTLLSVLEALPNVKHVGLSSMDLSETGLRTSNSPSATNSNHSLPISLADAGLFSSQVSLTLSSCTIRTTPDVSHDAISVLPLSVLTLRECSQLLIIQDEWGAGEWTTQLRTSAEFAIRLCQLMPGRVVLPDW